MNDEIAVSIVAVSVLACAFAAGGLFWAGFRLGRLARSAAAFWVGFRMGKTFKRARV